jgi:hypothetical protein
MSSQAHRDPIAVVVCTKTTLASNAEDLFSPWTMIGQERSSGRAAFSCARVTAPFREHLQGSRVLRPQPRGLGAGPNGLLLKDDTSFHTTRCH